MKDIKNIAILVLVSLVIYFSTCNSKGNVKTQIKEVFKTETKIDTVYDTISNSVKVYIPKPYEVIKEVIIHDTIIDTLEIIGDYFSKKVYSDTIIGDSILINITDTIFKNSIHSRELTYQVVYPTLVKTEFKNKLYWGFDLNGNKSQINYLGIGLLLNNKKDNILGLGVGVNGTFNPTMSFKFYKRF
jgi:hypothetical protein